jgi:hypothetical protein
MVGRGVGPKTRARESSWADWTVQRAYKRFLSYKLARPGALAARVCLACLVLVVASGCGNYKEQLESAKQQIDKLTSESKRSAEVSANLEKERARLSDELKLLSDKSARMEQNIGELQKAKASLDDELGKIRKRNSELQEELSSLKKEKGELLRQVEDLKRSAAELVQPEKLPVSRPTETAPDRSPREQVARQSGKLTPCDAIVEFMKNSGEIVRQHKGGERAKLLEGVKQVYASQMEGAPEKAKKAAEAWVSELSSSWDSPKDDTVYSLISKRNAAMAACGKKPQDAGF